MSIIYPESCRNITSGALRQVTKGIGSTASGGLVSTKLIKHMAVNCSSDYFLKHEPAGVYMSDLEKTKTFLDDNTDAILASGRKLVEAAKDSSKQMSEATGKFRDGTEKLANAIDKMMKVAGGSEFSETVKLTESLVNSLERLAALEEKGLLEKVMKAMAK